MCMQPGAFDCRSIDVGLIPSLIIAPLLHVFRHSALG
jgi:hypothetical protein